MTIRRVKESKMINNSEGFSNHAKMFQLLESSKKIGDVLLMSNTLKNLYPLHQYSNLVNKSLSFSNHAKMFQLLESSKKIGDVLLMSNTLKNLYPLHQYSHLVNKSLSFSNHAKMFQPSEDFRKMCSSIAEGLEKMKNLSAKIRESGRTFAEGLETIKNSLVIPNTIDDNIYISQQVFQYDNPIRTDAKLEFNDNINSVAMELVNKVSTHIVKYIPDFENRINQASENLNSEQPEQFSSATLILRRILSDLAKKIEPTNTSEKYYTILENYIKVEYRRFHEEHLIFIVEEANRGVHNSITQNQAIQLFFHFLLFLSEINWNGITKTHLN